MAPGVPLALPHQVAALQRVRALRALSAVIEGRGVRVDELCRNGDDGCSGRVCVLQLVQRGGRMVGGE